MAFGVGGIIDPTGGASFDGTTGYISIPPPDTFGGFPTVGDFSVEGWFTVPPSFTGTGYLLTLTGTVSGIGITDGHPFAAVAENGGTTDTVTSTADDADGAWHYLALTRSNSTLTLYVDGVEVQTMTATGTLAFSGSQAGGIGSNGTDLGRKTAD